MVQHQLHTDYDTQRLFDEMLLLINVVRPHNPIVSDASQVVFRLDNACYSIPASRVHVIQPLAKYTPLPFTRPWIVGVVSVRSRLLIVIDIRPLLAYERSAPKPDSVILWVTLHGMDIGLLADGLVTASSVAQTYTGSEQACCCHAAR
jgi:chemotaxis signal transduction protein